jgi:hypothetical protein
MDSITICNNFVSGQPGAGVCAVQFYGNRPVSDHQTYQQYAVWLEEDKEPVAIVLGANTVAISYFSLGAIGIENEFRSQGYQPTKRTWKRRDTVYTIWEK